MTLYYYHSAFVCIGTYSTEAGILYNNRYPTVLTSSTTSSSSSRKRDSRSIHSNTTTSSSSTATDIILKNTKYPDDFFSKPKPTCIGSSSKRRRTSLDTTTTIDPDLNLNLEYTNGHTKHTDASAHATSNGTGRQVESKVASVIHTHNLLVSHSTTNGYLIPPFTTPATATATATAATIRTATALPPDKGAIGHISTDQDSGLPTIHSNTSTTSTDTTSNGNSSSSNHGDAMVANNMRVTRSSALTSSPNKPPTNSSPTITSTTSDDAPSIQHHTLLPQHTLLPSTSKPIVNASAGPVSLSSSTSSGVTSGTITGTGTGDVHPSTGTGTIDSHTRMFLTTLMMDKQCAHIRRAINMIQTHPQIVKSIHNYTYTKSLNGQASGQIALKNTTEASTTTHITNNLNSDNDINPSPGTMTNSDNSNTTTASNTTTTNSNDSEYITLTHTQWLSLLNAKKHIDDLILKFLTPPN